jgi:hypothetical protein
MASHASTFAMVAGLAGLAGLAGWLPACMPCWPAKISATRCREVACRLGLVFEYTCTMRYKWLYWVYNEVHVVSNNSVIGSQTGISSSPPKRATVRLCVNMPNLCALREMCWVVGDMLVGDCAPVRGCPSTISWVFAVNSAEGCILTAWNVARACITWVSRRLWHSSIAFANMDGAPRIRIVFLSYSRVDHRPIHGVVVHMPSVICTQAPSTADKCGNTAGQR